MFFTVIEKTAQGRAVCHLQVINYVASHDAYSVSTLVTMVRRNIIIYVQTLAQENLFIFKSDQIPLTLTSNNYRRRVIPVEVVLIKRENR